jgi:hypothetical protein
MSDFVLLLLMMRALWGQTDVLQVLESQRHHNDCCRCIRQPAFPAVSVRLVCLLWLLMMRALRRQTDVLQVLVEQLHHDD